MIGTPTATGTIHFSLLVWALEDVVLAFLVDLTLNDELLLGSIERKQSI